MKLPQPTVQSLVIGAMSAAVAFAAAAAPPQTVYRCGPDGRVYSQTPCADGKPVTIDDPRSASQQKAARDVAARDAQQAKQLAEERKQREAAAKPQPRANTKNSSAGEPASAPARKAKVPVAASNMSPPMLAVPQPATTR